LKNFAALQVANVAGDFVETSCTALFIVVSSSHIG
jgi:hypothetical protein